MQRKTTLGIVKKWLISNQLTLNLDKSLYLAYGSYSNSVPVTTNVHVDKYELKRVYVAKYLGVLIDSKMSWDARIQNVIKKTKYLLFVLWKLSHFMPAQVLTMIFHALFGSIANYGLLAWGGAYSNALSPLENLQKRMWRIIQRKDNSVANVIQLRDMFNIESIVHYFAELHDQYTKSTSITRRKILPLPRINTTSFFKNSRIVAIKFFNELPESLKKANVTRVVLKKHVKDHLLKKS